jgi:hypothetical protein
MGEVLKHVEGSGFEQNKTTMDKIRNLDPHANSDLIESLEADPRAAPNIYGPDMATEWAAIYGPNIGPYGPNMGPVYGPMKGILKRPMWAHGPIYGPIYGPQKSPPIWDRNVGPF